MSLRFTEAELAEVLREMLRQGNVLMPGSLKPASAEAVLDAVVAGFVETAMKLRARKRAEKG